MQTAATVILGVAQLGLTIMIVKYLIQVIREK